MENEEVKTITEKVPDEKVETVWRKFWEPIVCTEAGKLDYEAVKNELYDYWYMLKQIPRVYVAITGGKLSKPNYSAETMIEEFESYLEKRCQEAVEDYKEEIR